MADGADLKQRFEITVPSPSVRINMGQPVTEKGKPTFGYVGMSLQSDVDLYVDVNKNTFHQASHVLHQAGGNWLQYSDGPMYLTTVASQHLASSDQLSLFAGAGYGNETGLDHGQRVRAHKYNNLEKHHRTDEIQNGLFEFLYGRRGRNPKVTHGYEAGGFDSGSAKRSKALETEDELKGFRAMVDKSQEELGFAETDPAWIEEVTSMSASGRSKATDPVTPGGVPKKLEYGFSPYFKRFDPYNKTDPKSASSPILKLVLLARNALARGRRIVDATRKAGKMVTDNAFSARALKLAEAVDGFGSAWGAMNSVIARHPFQAVRWVDEYNSGFAARAGAASDQAAGEGKQAKIRSAVGPFGDGTDGANSLQNGDTLEIEAPTRGVAKVASLPIVATKAKVNGSGVVQTGWSGDVTVTYEGRDAIAVAFTTAETASEADVLAHLNASLREPAVLAGQRLAIASNHEGSASRLQLTASPAVLANLGFGNDLSTSASGSTINAPSTTTFPIDAGVLTIEAAGSSAPMAIDFSAAAMPTLAALISALNAAWAAGRPSGSELTIAADAAGKLALACTSHPLTVTASSRALFEQLGLASASGDQTVDSGPPQPANNVADVREVTVDELASLLSNVDGVTVEGGAIVITSPVKGAGSYVRGWEVGGGTMAGKVGLDWENEVTGLSEARDDFAVVNHELQKLPEDARNLARPITECLEDVMALASGLEGTVEALMETVAPDGFLPGPPAALGLFGKEGISIGTPDRVVGAAGLGFVFMADGGTGQRDRNKFAGLGGFIEKPITAVLEWVPPFMKSEGGADEPETNLGFRVCSDTTVNLTATSTAELLALGRAMVGANARGIGVARVAGSRSAEVAGYEKVSIGARAKQGSEAVPDGGRVELVADTIAIGAGDDGTRSLMGIKNLAETWKVKAIDGTDTELELGGRQMTLDAYPLTRNVTVESSEAAVVRVGKCAIRVVKDEGLYFGWDVDPDLEAAKKKPLEDEVERLQAEQTAKTASLTELEAKVALLDISEASGLLDDFGKIRLTALKRRAARFTTELDKLTKELTAAQAAVAAFPEPDDALVPVLEIKYGGIALGFRKGVNGDVADGPHLLITDKGFSLETGEAGKEVSLATDADGAKLIVNAETEWATAADVSVQPKGGLKLEPTGDVSIKGGNVKITQSGTIQIG